MLVTQTILAASLLITCCLCFVGPALSVGEPMPGDSVVNVFAPPLQQPIYSALALLDHGELETERDPIGRKTATLKKFLDVELDSPLYEARETDVFGVPRERMPVSPPRLTNTTLEEFRSYFIRGIPVIVTDVLKDLPLHGYDCKRISKEFGAARMRRSYVELTEKDLEELQRKRDEERTKLRAAGKDDSELADGLVEDQTKIGDESWMRTTDKIENRNEGDTGPEFAPFYWGVKELKPSNPMRRKIASLTRLPYFMRDTVNHNIVNTSAEMWFSTSKAGARVHADPHCESTMSIQLAGQKRWRLSPPPPITNTLAMRRMSDGDVDTAAWRPVYEFTLSPGEGVFFPPATIHETLNVGDGCASSMTYQWIHPVPILYLRDFLPRLLLGEASHGCQFEEYAIWPTIVKGLLKKLPPTKAKALKTAKNAFDRLDRNDDGFVSKKELLKYLARAYSDEDLGEMFDMEDLTRSQHRRLLQDFTRDTLSYHDRDGDEKISRPEYLSSYMSWWHGTMLSRQGKLLGRQYRVLKKRSKCEDKQRAQNLAMQRRVGTDKAAVDPADRSIVKEESAAFDTAIKALSTPCRALVKKLDEFLDDGDFSVTHDFHKQFPELHRKRKVKDEL